ncbi:hypothetical protein ACEWY4_008908 [Coilia grayii]|uniref:Uncharacterized protein n=1 Tax=Coilia grayii TaxID=363190 RepID=A0ABD1K506_9TELE
MPVCCQQCGGGGCGVQGPPGGSVEYWGERVRKPEPWHAEKRQWGRSSGFSDGQLSGQPERQYWGPCRECGGSPNATDPATVEGRALCEELGCMSCLLDALQDTTAWLSLRDEQLAQPWPLGGDVAALQHQKEAHRLLVEEVKSRGPCVLSLVESAQESQSMLDTEEAFNNQEGDPEWSGASRVWQQAAVVEALWGQVMEQCSVRERHLEATLILMEDLQAAMGSVALELGEALGVQQAWEPLGELLVDALQDHIDAIQLFEEELVPVGEGVRRVKELAQQLSVSGVQLSLPNTQLLQQLSHQWTTLQMRKRSTALQKYVGNSMRGMACSSKPTPLANQEPDKKSSQILKTQPSTRLLTVPARKPATKSSTRARFPKAVAPANRPAQVSKPADKKACMSKTADIRQPSCVKKTGLTSPRLLVKESTLQDGRTHLKGPRRSSLTKRQASVCSDLSGAVTKPSLKRTPGTTGQYGTAVKTQSSQSSLTTQPPWRMGTGCSRDAPAVCTSDVLRPPLKPCLSYRYGQQPASQRWLKMRGSQGRPVHQHDLREPRSVAPGYHTEGMWEESPESSSYQNRLIPISPEPAAVNHIQREESAHSDTPIFFLSNRAESRRSVRQQNNLFPLQDPTQAPQTATPIEDPDVVDLSHWCSLNLPNFPYAQIHLKMPTGCCCPALCEGEENNRRQVSSSESSSEYEYESEYESQYEYDYESESRF